MNAIEYKEIDLVHLSQKSDKFKDWYKTALENRGYEILFYGDALDQKPYALSLNDWEGYKSEWYDKHLTYSNHDELDAEMDYIEDTCLTPIIF